METKDFFPSDLQPIQYVVYQEQKRHDKVVSDMMAFAEALWGPQINEDSTENWRTFTDIEGFKVEIGITNGEHYFIPYPTSLLENPSEDDFTYFSRLYIEKNGDMGEVTGIGGFSGPFAYTSQVGSDFEQRGSITFWENSITN